MCKYFFCAETKYIFRRIFFLGEQTAWRRELYWILVVRTQSAPNDDLLGIVCRGMWCHF